MNYSLLMIPAVSAGLGWLGCWAGSKLFVYRAFPKQKQRFAEQTGQIISAAFPREELQKKIKDPEAIARAMPVIERHIDDFLRNKLKEKMPVIGMFISDKTILVLKEIFIKEIEEMFPQVLEQFTSTLQGEINFDQIIQRTITGVRSEQVEKLIGPGLRWFQLCGLVTGLFSGAISLMLFLILR